MTMLVVGLFEERNEAQAAVQDLANSGYDRHAIQVKESFSAQDRSGDMSDLSQELQTQGVPDRDARAYVSGVKSGDTLAYLQTSDDRADLARDIMNRHGALDIHHAHEVRSTTTETRGVATGAAVGTAAVASTAHTTPTTGRAATGTTGTNEVAIPVIEEQLAVGKRQVQRGGALIHTYVTERPVEETVTLREEHVNVERHPVNRPVTSADTAAMREGTFEVTERAEEAVVAKNARVVEEVVVSKEATEHTETIRDTVRRTDVDVDELDDDDLTTTTGTTAGTTGTTSTGRI